MQVTPTRCCTEVPSSHNCFKRSSGANCTKVLWKSRVVKSPLRPAIFSRSSAKFPQKLIKNAVMPFRDDGKAVVAPTSPLLHLDDLRATRRKTRVVVLGSGWGGISFVKNMNPQLFGENGRYELTMVSPRNYFLYTPLLPAACAGTVDEHSIAEPVRSMLKGKGSFAEAECLSIDPVKKVVTCRKLFCEVCMARKHIKHTDRDHIFELHYDVLIMGVGAVNNTFGVEGVKEHAYFMKTMEEGRALRQHVSKLLEIAALPTTTPEERKKMLSFVVVGVGPSGVEVAAELYDLLEEDVRKLFPTLKEDISISLVHTQNHLLSMYDRDVAEYTTQHFKRRGIQMYMNTKVSKVQDGSLVLCTTDENGKSKCGTVPFGTCVWCTGIALNPLAKQLKDKLPAADQAHSRSLVVDKNLQVKGGRGTIFALGDCATVEQTDVDKDGKLSRAQLVQALSAARREFPHLDEYVRHLHGKWMVDLASGSAFNQKDSERPDDKVSFEEFKTLLYQLDNRMRSLPATAQVARQQGEYLAQLFGKYHLGQEDEDGEVAEVPASAPTFQYVHMGSLAYIGGDRAVMKLPFEGVVGVLKGWLMGWAWRGMETFMQISLRNQWMVANDFLRTKVFGRNISDV